MSKKQILRDAKRIAAEALLGYRCSIHPNIVQIYGFYVDLNSGERMMERPMIVMERMHITLFELLHYKKKDIKLSYSRRFQFLLDIARAIEFIHLQGIVHHDVKSLNILLNSDFTEAKLADFGEAKVKGLNTTRMQLSTILSTSAGRNNIAGTVAYQAPEILSEEVKETSRISEMYSFGVTIWECLTSKIPHKGKKEGSITVLALTKKHLPMLKVPTKPPIDGEEAMSQADSDTWVKMQVAASKCLSRNRAVRPTASELVRDWNRMKAPISTSISMVVSAKKNDGGPAGNTHVTDSTVTTMSLPTSGHTTTIEDQEKDNVKFSEDPETVSPIEGASINQNPQYLSVNEEKRTMFESLYGRKRVLALAFIVCLVVIIGVVVAVVLSSENPENTTSLEACRADVPDGEPVTHAMQWGICDIIISPFDTSSQSFELEYSVSSYIKERQIQVDIYDEGCEEGGVLLSDNPVFQSIEVVFSHPGAGQLDGAQMNRTVLVHITLDKDRILSNDSSNPFRSSYDNDLEIKFCVRFGLLEDTSIRKLQTELCTANGEFLSCQADSQFEVNDEVLVLDASIECPLDAVDQSQFVEASQQGKCQCDATLRDIDQTPEEAEPINCDCFACPVGSTFGFAYECDRPIIFNCLTFNCFGQCNGSFHAGIDTETDAPTAASASSLPPISTPNPAPQTTEPQPSKDVTQTPSPTTPGEWTIEVNYFETIVHLVDQNHGDFRFSTSISLP